MATMGERMLGTGFFLSNNYDNVRSSYSSVVEKEVRRLFAEKEQLRIAEIGAGSGKFTEVIFKAGLDIKELNIIEPDSIGIKLHQKKFANKTSYFISYHNASAEATTLEEKSIDVIFVAHAFHWFDFKRSKIEFHRILREQGKIFILGRFLDQNDSVSAKYLTLTRWGKRNSNFKNNIEAYSEERMSSFYGHPVKMYNICTETEMYSLKRLLAGVQIRIDASGDESLRTDESAQKEIINNIESFFSQNHNDKGTIPLKFNTFYYSSTLF